MRGRALEPVPFDGKTLGEDLKRIRPPIPEFTIFGGMMVDRTDINHLLNVRKVMAFPRPLRDHPGALRPRSVVRAARVPPGDGQCPDRTIAAVVEEARRRHSHGNDQCRTS